MIKSHFWKTKTPQVSSFKKELHSQIRKHLTKGTTLRNILSIDGFDLIQMEFIMTPFLYMPFNEEDNLKEEEIDKKSELLEKWMRKLQEMKTETRQKGKKKIKSPTNSQEIVTKYEIKRIQRQQATARDHWREVEFQNQFDSLKLY